MIGQEKPIAYDVMLDLAYKTAEAVDRGDTQEADTYASVLRSLELLYPKTVEELNNRYPTKGSRR